jgi:hypothetical protein
MQQIAQFSQFCSSYLSFPSKKEIPQVYRSVFSSLNRARVLRKPNTLEEYR